MSLRTFELLVTMEAVEPTARTTAALCHAPSRMPIHCISSLSSPCSMHEASCRATSSKVVDGHMEMQLLPCGAMHPACLCPARHTTPRHRCAAASQQKD